MTPALAYSILTGFGLIMFTTGLIRRYSQSVELFLVSRRSVGTLVGAMGVAAAWVWAPSLFLAAQKSYQQGIAGLMWFTVPNVLSLVLFAWLAVRIRAVFPKGYTLPEYIALRFDAKTHVAYLFSFLSLQACSLAVQLIAGASMLHSLCGTPYAAAVILLALTSASYSLLDGLHSSVRAHVLQLLLIYLGIILLVPGSIQAAGGLSAVWAGLGGASGKFGNVFDPHVAYSFGITVSIGLLSGPAGDQKFWQRAFAFREKTAFRGFLLGAALFAVVPISMSVLGFIAAGSAAAAPAVASGAVTAQQVGPEVVRTLLPDWGLVVFVVIVLAGLTATGDSALCAGGSLIAVDIYRKYMNPAASETQMVRVSRWSTAGMCVVGICIALVPGITILSLFLFYGTLRSAVLAPTIFALCSTRVTAWGIFLGVVCASVMGVPSYVYGELTGSVDVKIAANIGIVIVSTLAPLISIFIGERSDEMPILQQ